VLSANSGRSGEDAQLTLKSYQQGSAVYAVAGKHGGFEGIKHRKGSTKKVSTRENRLHVSILYSSTNRKKGFRKEFVALQNVIVHAVGLNGRWQVSLQDLGDTHD
jgi:hypothetical protein